MGKIAAFFKSRYFYAVIFLYILGDALLKGPLENTGVFLYLYRYFGKFSYVIAFILFANLILSFLRRSDEKPVFPITVEFLLIGFLCGAYLFFMLRMGIPLENRTADESLLRNAVDLLLFQKDGGLIPAWLFYFLLSKFNFIAIYAGLFVILLICVSFAVFVPLGKGILGFRREYLEREALEAEKRALLREKKQNISPPSTSNPIENQNDPAEPVEIQTEPAVPFADPKELVDPFALFIESGRDKKKKKKPAGPGSGLIDLPGDEKP
ncbi:MAG: hypothetical protein LBQ96_08450 [Fusobacteriaceae bacterium]|jgi:hypothetical protein|nr:hypothetical protein [Fusobacteriaceae bacterium]